MKRNTRDVTSLAMARLARLPDSSEAGEIDLPFPHTLRYKLPRGKRLDYRGVESPEWQRLFAGEVTLPINALLGTQPTVGREGVAYQITHTSDPVIVVRQPDGRLVIADGHHRVMARILRGARTARALVYWV